LGVLERNKILNESSSHDEKLSYDEMFNG